MLISPAVSPCMVAPAVTLNLSTSGASDVTVICSAVESAIFISKSARDPAVTLTAWSLAPKPSSAAVSL